ncbi:glycosyltransferase family 61 protein [Ancylobacter radicis]|uniref:Glycosyltransferase family 61 protein n=1 Tax=Ancylobacter radicis TaxID=2836179 RepID=A0ABS5RDB6_9HYPH|nr:glycosyltransferase family 61 protein [Ancylobacter radicis]MBS9478936.1 glycosyltransferase family 61 protein [Ancylobacter radicis]
MLHKTSRKVPVQAVLAHAAERRWSEVIAATADVEALAGQPMLLPLRIEAALEDGNDEEVRRTIDVVERATLRAELRFAAVRPLLKFARPADAWRVLSADGSITGHHRYIQQVRKVLAYSHSEPELVSAIQAALDALLGEAVEPSPSDYSFRDDPARRNRPMGEVRIVASTEVEPRHVEGLSVARDRFRRRLSKPAAPSVCEYHDVFVDPTGQIWTEDGSIIVTTGRPIAHTSREACRQLDVALPALRGTRGIYHWVVDLLPHLSLLGPEPDIPVLIGAHGPRFERESLALAGIADEQVIAISEVVFVRRLVVPSVGMAGLRHWQATGGIFERVAARAGEMAAANGFACPEKVYISRRDSTRRRLLNEEELEGALQQRGYAVVLMSTMPLWQQIALASGVRSIVAPHGAGLSHLMFCRGDTRVLELLPIMDGSYTLRFNYARLALALGYDYTAWLEPQLARSDHWRVCIDELPESLL